VVAKRAMVNFNVLPSFMRFPQEFGRFQDVCFSANASGSA
jgi:hypothetical protein